MLNKATKNNITWLFMDKIVRMFGGLFVGIWVARYLGPKDFGVLSYAVAYTGLFVFFVNLGLDQIMVRELVRRPLLKMQIMGSGFILKLSGSILSIILIVITQGLIEADNVTKVVIFVVSIGFVFQSLDTIDYFYQSLVLSKYIVAARNIAFIASMVAQIYFIINEYPVMYFAIAKVVELAITSMLFVYVHKRSGFSVFDWKISKLTIIRLLKYSWPLGLSVFLISIYTRIDQVMINNMLGNEEVGVYSAAVRLSEAWLFIPTIIISTLMPLFVELRRNNPALYSMRLMQLYSMVFWLGVFVSLIVVLVGEELIVLIFGGEYKDAYKALVFNVWAGIAMSHAGARGIWLINENLQIYRLYSNIISVFLNIGLNLVLINYMGIAGAALATLITQSVATWVTSLFWGPIRPSTVGLIKSINPKNMIVKI